MTDNRIEQVKKIITDLCDGCEVDGVSTGLIEIASKEIVSALYSEPQVCQKPEQMMICPKAKECGEECFYPDHQIPHADNWGCTKPHNSNGCPACIPVPSTPTSEGMLLQALQDDASDLWKVTNAIKKEIESRSWIMEGRGCYAWDDNRYKDETRIAFEAVLELIKNVQHPAQLRFHEIVAKATPLIEARARDSVARDLYKIIAETNYDMASVIRYLDKIVQLKVKE